MPRDLRWKIALVVMVLIFACLAAYPTRDTLLWHGEVIDHVNSMREVGHREFTAPEGEDPLAPVVIDNKLAYYLDKATLGVFHHPKERYEDEQLLGPKKDKKGVLHNVVRRKVYMYSAGLTPGLDLAGGAELRYQIESHGDNQGRDAEKVIDIIRKRIDAMGLKEPVLQKEGNDRLLIQLPGQDDQETLRMKSIIESTGHLEFRLVSGNEALNRRALNGDIPEGYSLYTLRNKFTGDSEQLLVSNKAELTGTLISGTGVQVDQQTREIQVTLDFNAAGRRRFASVTQANVGQRLAIILDDIRDTEGKIKKQGTLYSAPKIREAIASTATITGGFSQNEAEDLQTTLDAGGLPATLVLEGHNQVGPSLGNDSIASGKLASFIGAGAVFLFMLFYYRKGGLISNLALLLNILLIIGYMAAYGATLTLPGIAGIALTIGMAVDANVLIFERIREEVERKGADHLGIAIRDGYARATVTIVDSNLTTLATALFLLLVGTGPVKGFATTLSLGIIFSMFTAIFVTRVVFDLLLAKGWLHKLPMIKIFGKTSVPFHSKWRYGMICSAALIAIGLTALIAKGADNFDIDFRGGTMVHVVTDGDLTDNDVRQLVTKEYPDASVQSIKTAKPALATRTALDGIKYPATKQDVLAHAQSRQAGADVIQALRHLPDQSSYRSAAEIVGTIKTGTASYSEYEIKTRLRGQAEIMIEPLGDSSGYLHLIEVLIDKSIVPDQIKAKLEARGMKDMEVAGVGAKKSDGFMRFEIRSKEADAKTATDTVRGVFDDFSVKNDIARLLQGRMAPEPFAELKSEGGNVSLVANFKTPVSAAELKRTMVEEWKYDKDSTKVAVKGSPEAAAGTTIEIATKAQANDPEHLCDKISAHDIYKVQLSQPFASVMSVGGHVVGMMQQRAIIAIILSLITMVGYLWFRFELKFGLAAVAALVHDVCITLGALAIAGIPLNLTILAAILTIIGYSVNDTVVIFDRIRENLNLFRRERYESIANMSINQTISRTLLTSITTLFAVVALYVWGGGAIKNFAFALIVGVITGTYSSMFIATPIVVWWHAREEKKRHAVSSSTAPSIAASRGQA
ncbi:MAG TPA: protein translocase subunit SecD [Planctomycetota bacterium]|nr:protein translocase subunit SecD [Planctomycetota bacterium]